MPDNPAPITIRYKTEITEPRAGLPGAVARAAAKQPYLAGFIGGLALWSRFWCRPA